MAEINQARLRLYKFLITVGRILIDAVPEPYKSEIESEVE